MSTDAAFKSSREKAEEILGKSKKIAKGATIEEVGIDYE